MFFYNEISSSEWSWDFVLYWWLWFSITPSKKLRIWTKKSRKHAKFFSRTALRAARKQILFFYTICAVVRFLFISCIVSIFACWKVWYMEKISYFRQRVCAHKIHRKKIWIFENFRIFAIFQISKFFFCVFWVHILFLRQPDPYHQTVHEL